MASNNETAADEESFKNSDSLSDVVVFTCCVCNGGGMWLGNGEINAFLSNDNGSASDMWKYKDAYVHKKCMRCDYVSKTSFFKCFFFFLFLTLFFKVQKDPESNYLCWGYWQSILL